MSKKTLYLFNIKTYYLYSLIRFWISLLSLWLQDFPILMSLESSFEPRMCSMLSSSLFGSWGFLVLLWYKNILQMNHTFGNLLSFSFLVLFSMTIPSFACQLIREDDKYSILNKNFKIRVSSLNTWQFSKFLGVDGLKTNSILYWFGKESTIDVGIKSCCFYCHCIFLCIRFSWENKYTKATTIIWSPSILLTYHLALLSFF